MSRMVSFAILVAILFAVAILFFRVMANFLLPLFMALLLVVMFRPVYAWMTEKCKGRQRLAAGLTTATIVLAVLGPLSLVAVQASREGAAIYRELEVSEINLEKISKGIADFGKRFGMELDPKEIEAGIVEKFKEFIAPIALSTAKYTGGILVGIAIMIVSLYYFFADGPGMVRAVMKLSPLDDRYEEQMIEQFDKISRAVLLATLLSALVQGLLAGVGFYFAGFESVFLMMFLAMLFAMIPFIGAAAVWVPACLWLYFHDGRTVAAIVLAIRRAAVVSMIDNLIKPLVLHGTSNLHPLLALLSVLGGVQALGPIGIFVGPMVVVFLHVVLNMIQSELDEMEGKAATEGSTGFQTGGPQA